MFNSIINKIVEFSKDVKYAYLMNQLKKYSNSKKLKETSKYLTKWLDIKEIPYDNYNIVIVDSIDKYVGITDWGDLPPRGLAKYPTREIILDITRIKEDAIVFNQPLEIMLIIYVLHEARHTMQYKYVEDNYGKDVVGDALELNNSLMWFLSEMEVDATEYSKNFVLGIKYDRSVEDVMEKFLGYNTFREVC